MKPQYSLITEGTSIGAPLFKLEFLLIGSLKFFQKAQAFNENYIEAQTEVDGVLGKIFEYKGLEN